MRTKFNWVVRYAGAWLAAGCLALLVGCGGGTSANVITVTVTPTNQSIIVGTTLTLTATEGGVTTTMVTWTCTFTTTPPATSGTTPMPSSPADCMTAHGAVGSISNPTATTVVYNAPAVVPDSTKFPSLVVTITATATADTKKTGHAMLILDSGIAFSISPLTATVPTKEQEQFRVIGLVNDTQNKGIKWLISQTNPNSTTPPTPIPMLPTCSPDCGMIDPMLGLYTAPATVPTSTKNTTTPAVVNLYAIANADTTRIVQGTITIVLGGPITFNSITPNFAPQGAQLWDIYLNAPGMSSSSSIKVTDLTTMTSQSFDSVHNPQQVKILFPIPTTTNTTPTSTGARLRLSSNITPPALQDAHTFSVSVSDPAETVTANSPAASYQFTVKPVRATSVATGPDGFNLSVLSNAVAVGGQSQINADGGYFGANGTFVNLLFGGNQVAADTTRSDARHVIARINDSSLTGLSPGLYPLALGRTAAPFPNPNNPAVTNLSLFPDYSSSSPVVTGSVAAGNNPGAIDIDPTLGVVVVAETGSNAIQFYRIASTVSGGVISDTLVPIDSVSGQDCGVSCPVTQAGGVSMNLPTGVSVNSNNHTVAVVNYGSQAASPDNGKTVGAITGQSVMALPIPVPGGPQNPAITPFAIDISNILQGSVVPAPMPYAIGVDPDTNLALVAYSSTSTSNPADLGFVFNLNPNTAGSNSFGCNVSILPPPPSPAVGQCVFSQVTLNTGVYPQIAVAPQAHLAIVTPGGTGVVRGVDVTQSFNNSTNNKTFTNSVQISAIMIGAGTVTVATAAPTDLVPGNAGSVLITGVPLPGMAQNTTTVNFNGVYSVAVNSATSFSYSVTNTAASATIDLTHLQTGQAIPMASFGLPNLNFPGSGTTQGIAINPITRSAALADANATGTNGPQINLLNSLDQATSSITFFAGCTAFTNPCSNGPELLGTTRVAWQPYTNAVVSYNPGNAAQPQVSQPEVSVSDPMQLRRFAIVPNLGPGAITLTNQTSPAVSNGSTNTLTLWGGIAVDPATNYAFVAESGSLAGSGGNPPPNPGKIELISLGPTAKIAIKPVHVTQILVPNSGGVTRNIGGVPNATVPQATLTSATALANLQIFGSGFGSDSQVLLDGMVAASVAQNTAQLVNNSDRELTATIPAAFLTMPHKFALQVTSSGVTSNAVDFVVIGAVDLTKVCTGGSMPQPIGVTIADQIMDGPFSPVAVVTNSGCNNIAIIDINPANASFGTIIKNTPVGTKPEGIAVSQRFGLAVVANNGDGTASVIDLTNTFNPMLPLAPAVPAVTTGTNAQPLGVATNEATGATLIANFNANTVSVIDISPIRTKTPPPTMLTAATVSGIQQPIAVAIDPDRGPSNQGIAVVTALQLISQSSPVGALAVVDIGQASPALSTTIASGSISATPTGVVFDPSVVTGTTNNGVFYASSSGSNQVSIFNPDTGGGTAVSVGFNPTSLAYNPQTGGLLTTNLGSNTVSIVDMLSSPIMTRQTLGLPSSQQFGVAIDQFTNFAVIIDSANNRALIMEMPN